MKKDAIYLIKLLDKTPAEAWAERLRVMLISDGFQEKPDNPQSCIVSFALNQAKRRLDHTRAIGKKTFGIEELIVTLSAFDKEKGLQFYSIEDHQYLGTCYVADGRILGCECVLKTGTVSKPGLWIDGKQIT